MRASWSFSKRISQAVDSKEAAKSAFCWAVRWLASSWDGVVIGKLQSAWTARRTAVLRPEKEKSRPSSLGWGSLYLVGLPCSAHLAMEGPPG